MERNLCVSKGKKIAILATNGFEQAELEVPRDRLRAAGALVDVVSLAPGEIKRWDKKDWGRSVKVDKTLGQVSAAEYDAVVLPGGQINPDLLRVRTDGAEIHQRHLRSQEDRRGCMSRALAANRDWHRQRPKDDLL
jgi:putative intracellular protease/amidase